MFIGEAPEYQDGLFGQPFSGQAGMMLTQFLSEVGINRNECSLAFVTQCATPKGRPPETDEIKACHDILDYYIAKANPKIIVPIGNVALKRISKRSGITKYNGHVVEAINYPGKTVIPIISPQFVLRDPQNATLIRHGLSKVKDALDGKAMERLSKVTYVDTYEKFDEMIKSLSSRKQFAIDIETSSKDWLNGYIVCISFSNQRGESWVLPWVIGDEAYYDFCRKFVITNKKRKPITDIPKFCLENGLNHPKYKWENLDVFERLKNLLLDESITKVLHNYAFDYKYLEAKGLIIKGKIYDTMIMHHQLDERRKTHGLKECAMVHTPYGQYEKSLDKILVEKKDKIFKDKIKDSYALVPLEILNQYAGTDADATLMLWYKFLPEIMQQGLFNIYHGFLFPLTQMLMQTEKNGMYVDTELVDKYEGILEGYIKNTDNNLNEHTKEFVHDPIKKPLVKGLNYRSTPQLKNFMFSYLKLPPVKWKDKAKLRPSVDEEVLEKLASVSDFCKLLLDRRKKDKVLTTYVKGVKRNRWSDGSVHTNFYIHGTLTGRLSSAGPNMQNIPRNPVKGDGLYELGVNIKDLFIVKDSDYLLVETDYSQAELRLIAEYSKDVNLYNAFMAGRDPHAELAVRIYHPDKIALMESGVDARTLVTKEERQNAKTANFALCYGKHPKNFAQENNLSLAEATHIFTVYWQTFKGIAAWKEQVIAQAKIDLFFRTVFGRKRRLETLNSTDEWIRARAEREGINFVIQSQASDNTLWSAMRMLKICKETNIDARTVSFVHDSVVYLVHKSQIQQFLTLLYKTMLHPPGVTIPMESEVKVGNRLGSLKEWVNKDNIWIEKPKKVKIAA